MKRIELTINDEACPRLLSAIAEHPVMTLHVEGVEPPNNPEVEQIAAYILSQGRVFQDAGRKNSVTTTEELAAGIRHGDHRPMSPDRQITYAGGGGGGSPNAGKMISIDGGGSGGGSGGDPTILALGSGPEAGNG